MNPKNSRNIHKIIRLYEDLNYKSSLVFKIINLVKMNLQFNSLVFIQNTVPTSKNHIFLEDDPNEVISDPRCSLLRLVLLVNI